MLRTIFCVVVLGALLNVTFAGEYTYVFDGQGEYADHHAREWTQCNDYESIPDPNMRSFSPALHGKIGPLTYNFELGAVDWGNGNGDWYMVRRAQPVNPEAIQCRGSYWTWRVDYTDGISQYDVSYWGSPGALDEKWPFTDPFGKYTTDAADAGIMFLYWGTPVADFTGDGMTDAADAGRLFEEWTGDSTPASVPEPSGLGWFLLVLPLLRKRNNI